MANYQLTHTGAEVDDAVSIALNIYRVGSIYMSIDPTDPSTLFGGTWERIKDRFLLSAGDTYAAGATGGEATHTLTVNELPAHSHVNGILRSYSSYRPASSTTMAIDKYKTTAYDSENPSNYSTNETGSYNPAHNNMPPYLTVYMWFRTA